jgi:hypothetical protein
MRLSEWFMIKIGKIPDISKYSVNQFIGLVSVIMGVNKGKPMLTGGKKIAFAIQTAGHVTYFTHQGDIHVVEINNKIKDLSLENELFIIRNTKPRVDEDDRVLIVDSIKRFGYTPDQLLSFSTDQIVALGKFLVETHTRYFEFNEKERTCTFEDIIFDIERCEIIKKKYLKSKIKNRGK